MPVTASRSIRIELDPRRRLPAYLQIARQVQYQTSSGRLPAGTRLPTVRDLARRLGVNFNTVARAYRLLARDGSVSPQPGRGTFVLPAAARRKPGAAALQKLALEYIASARRLHFSDAQIAASLQYSLDREPALSPSGDNHE